MSVGVDQAWNDDVPPEVDHGLRRECSLDLQPGADGRDALAGDGDGGMVNRSNRRCDGYAPAASDH